MPVVRSFFGLRKITAMSLRYETKELSPSTWTDFEELFEKHGGVQGGCWCMFYHVKSGWRDKNRAQNKSEKHALVMNGKTHGVIVYNGGKPVGWCQFGPSEELPRIDNMKDYKPSHEGNLWRITCFFTDRDHRMTGVARAALKGALHYMKEHGVEAVEAYPVDPRKRHSSNMLWNGIPSLFDSMGFKKIRKLGSERWIFKKIL
jgi:GNAT superfamily N-acetyltransferase